MSNVSALERKRAKTNCESFSSDLLTWYDKNGRDFPWRQSNDAYEILIAEIMLTQTAAAKVGSIYANFLLEYPSPLSVVRERVEEIEMIIRPLGLVHRARRIRELCRVILKEYMGTVPEQQAELLTLPGVGPYIARAVMSFAYEKDVAVLDTNVGRILSRVFNTDTVDKAGYVPKKLWEFADSLVPPGKSKRYNYAILDFGSITCKARSPDCSCCHINAYCGYCS